MINLILDKTSHKGKEILLLKFPYDKYLIEKVKRIENIEWSNTQRAWYTVYSNQALYQIKDIFNGYAKIDASILKEKLAKEKYIKTHSNHNHLTIEAIDKIEKYKHWMRSKRYSDSTIETYTNALQSFLKFFWQKPITEINNNDVIVFNNEFILKHKLSASYQNQVVNAIKLFFTTIKDTTINIEVIHRPKRSKLLPNVLSKEEVKKILDAPQNLKHKAMLSLVYACGLRCGEILKLKPEHVDSKRNVLIIKQAKGRKDRIAPLSNKIIDLLRSYYISFKPKIYLFEGAIANNPYDERSLQNVIKQSVLKAGIKKPVTLHWLRHSYATHLLESGTDLRYIQEILGHSSSRTTEIYTHVSTKSIQNITSPFDYL